MRELRQQLMQIDSLRRQNIVEFFNMNVIGSLHCCHVALVTKKNSYRDSTVTIVKLPEIVLCFFPSSFTFENLRRLIFLLF